MFLNIILVLLLPCIVAGGPAIAFKYSDAYKFVWNDGGSKGKHDGSFWTVLNFQPGYCSIGDFAVQGYNHPTTKALLIKGLTSGTVIHPNSFSLVWNDGGSGAKYSVSVYRMHAPSGYVCLGDVVVPNFHQKPNKNNYCCVKREYAVQADSYQVYNDAETGADRDGSFWTIVRRAGDSKGIVAGNFIGVNGYHRPSPVYLLAAGPNVVDSTTLTKPAKPLNLYEESSLHRVWSDSGSGGKYDLTIWRAAKRDGYYPVGDIAVRTYSKPSFGYLIRPSDKDNNEVQVPISYHKIWTDAGSGADQDVALWKPNCGGGYVSLGYLATNGGYPKVGDIYCVKAKYTVPGSSSNWQWVWNDAETGSNRDVTVYEAVAKTSKQQSVRGFGAVSSYSYKPSSPSMLSVDSVAYYAEKPINEVIIQSIDYLLKQERKTNGPVQLSTATLINRSNRPQKTSRTLTFQVAEASTFTFSQSIAIGISIKTKAEIPFIGGAETTITATSTSTFTNGKTTTKTNTDSIQANMELPGNSKANLVIEGTKYTADIPFEANIIKVYFDGTRSPLTKLAGVYKGVAVSHFTVTYGKPEPLAAGDEIDVENEKISSDYEHEEKIGKINNNQNDPKEPDLNPIKKTHDDEFHDGLKLRDDKNEIPTWKSIPNVYQYQKDTKNPKFHHVNDEMFRDLKWPAEERRKENRRSFPENDFFDEMYGYGK